MQSHELWYGSSQPSGSSPSYNSNPSDPTQQPSSRRHGNNNNNNHLNGRTLISSTAPSNTLAALSLEECALRARKQNIASFGYAWIKPAGCAKTMLGMREEEAEREEAANALAAEMNAAFMDDGGPGQAGPGAARLGADGEEAGQDDDDQMLERDLDDDIPDADADGLVEEGEEGLEEEEDVDEDGLMQRDLDDDIPETFPDDDDDDDDDDEDDEDEDEQGDDDFDNQPDLDADIPAAEEGEGDDMMVRDLDDDVPDAAEDSSDQEEEWQHTDTEAEDDDDDARTDPFASSLLRASTASHNGLPPQPVQRETEAQRRFLQRWSGGGDAFDSSGMMLDEDDLRASLASQGSRRSGFGRRWSRRGGPRDSLE